MKQIKRISYKSSWRQTIFMFLEMGED